MADGFKIADAFVEVDAQTDKMGASVSRGVREVADTASGDADRVGNTLGARMGAGISRGLTSAGQSGSLFTNVLGVMASKMAITVTAGIGLVGILQQVSGVAGLLPSLGFAGAAAVGALALGMQGFGDALKNMGDPEKFSAALEKLSPNARAAALAVKSMVPAWTSMQQSVQDNLFRNIGTDIQSLGSNYIPVLKSGLGGVATSINGMVREWIGFANAPTTIRDTNYMFSMTRQFLDGIAMSIKPFAQGLTDIATVGSQFLPQLGQYIADIALKFSTFIAKARETGQLQTWIQSGIDALSQVWTVIKNVVISVTNLGSILGGPLLMALTLASQAILGITNFLVTWKDVLLPIAGGIAAVVAAMRTWTMVVSAVRMGMIALNLIMAMNPFTLIAMAVAAAVIAIIMNWDKVKAFLITTWNLIKLTATTVWNAITQFFTSTWNSIKNTATSVWNGIKNFFTSTWNSVKQTATSAWNGLKNFLSSVWNGIKSTATSIWNGIKSFFSSVIRGIINVIEWIGDVPGMVRGWFDSVKQIATNIWNSIVDFISGAIDRGISFVRKLGEVPGMVRDFFSRAASAASDMIGRLIDYVAAIPGKVTNALGNLGSLLYNAGKSLITGFINGIKNMVGSAVNAAKGVVSAVRDFFPFSPAKKGPFSGKGYTTHSGRALMADFAEGMVSKIPAVRRATLEAIHAASALSNVLGSGLQKSVMSRVQAVADKMDPSDPRSVRALHTQAVAGLANLRAGQARTGGSQNDPRLNEAIERLTRVASGTTININQTSGSATETGRMVALAMRTV